MINVRVVSSYIIVIPASLLKEQHQRSRSYTCELQGQMYADSPNRYPPAADEQEQQRYAREYICVPTLSVVRLWRLLINSLADL